MVDLCVLKSRISKGANVPGGIAVHLYDPDTERAIIEWAHSIGYDVQVMLKDTLLPDHTTGKLRVFEVTLPA